MEGERKFPEDADTAEMSKPPNVRRTRIPLWQALGTEQQLRDGKWAWVIFQDAIARILLHDRWVISGRGPRPLDQLSPVPAHNGRPLRAGDGRWTPDQLLVYSRDGVLCLQRAEAGDPAGAVPGTIVVEEMIVGEDVEPMDDFQESRLAVDIVRVTR